MEGRCPWPLVVNCVGWWFYWYLGHCFCKTISLVYVLPKQAPKPSLWGLNFILEVYNCMIKDTDALLCSQKIKGCTDSEGQLSGWHQSHCLFLSIGLRKGYLIPCPEMMWGHLWIGLKRRQWHKIFSIPGGLTSQF